MNQAKVTVTLKSDSGRIKISVWASSIEEAKEKVLRDQNAPLSAILSAKVERPSIWDIKRLTAESSPYFFSRSTLRFFQQKVSDFSVYRNGPDSFVIAANSWGGNVTKRIFNPFTRTLEQPA